MNDTTVSLARDPPRPSVTFPNSDGGEQDTRFSASTLTPILRHDSSHSGSPRQSLHRPQGGILNASITSPAELHSLSTSDQQQLATPSSKPDTAARRRTRSHVPSDFMPPTRTRLSTDMSPST